MKKPALALLLFFNLFILQAQQLRPPVFNFTPKNYGTGQTPDNHYIFQDNRGYIFVGNSGGILIHDGSSVWDFVEVQSGAYVTAIDQDKNGTIYVGTNGGEFGKLTATEHGKLKYISLKQVFEKKNYTIGWVQRLYCDDKHVYLSSDGNRVYVYTNKSVTHVPTENTFQLIYKCENQVYARERAVGLVALSGTEKKLVTTNNDLRDYGIMNVVPYDQNQLLIITKEKGLWVYNQKNHNTWCLSADSIGLKKHEIFGGIKLFNGNFALNTLASGVLILNSSGKIISVLNKASGLRVNDVKHLIEDKHHNLWLAMSNGIGLVNYGSFLHYYDDETGLLGGTECLVKQGNQLYVGTSEGLFTENIQDKSKHFSKIEISTGQVWDLQTSSSQVYAGTMNGVFRGESLSFERILRDKTNALAVFANDTRLLAAGEDVLYLMEIPSGKIIAENYFDEPLARVLSIKIDPSSTKNKTIAWMGSLNQGIVRIEINNDSLSHKVYANLEDYSMAWTRPVIIDNKIFFCTRGGLRKPARDENGIYFDFAEILPELDNVPVIDVRQTGERIWACADNKVFHYDDKNRPNHTPFLPIDMGRINQLYAEEKTTCWIAAADGLIRYTEFYDKNYKQSFDVVLRKLVINNDSVFFHGNWKGKKGLSNKQPSVKFETGYAFNSYEFTVSALYYEGVDKMLYAHLLRGHDEEWSSWSPENKIKYSNLSEGDYTLMVKAKNVYGIESNILEFRFRIHPPWYRTTLAYIGYGLLTVLLFIFVNRILSHRLKMKNIQLEGMVKERTREIEEKNVELHEQNQQIKHQKQEITDSINYAQKIQEAMLPFAKEMKVDIPESFVLFKPKDIVSGDFYWYGKFGSKMVVICADCTGHGVPGAFMSMLCIDKLNQIIPEKKILMPDKILEAANRGIKKSLGQSDEQNLTTKDGMDCAVLTIDLESNKLYYAGANRPLWRIRNNEITEFKADKCAVGGFTPEEKVYHLHEINIERGDCFYMSTDGYADQFGGPKGKKIMVRTFKEILLENFKTPFAQQSKILDTFVEDWKKHPDMETQSGEHEQVDDICVVGIKL